MTGSGATELLTRLTFWYYQLGGMYLSAAARRKYFAFMDLLKFSAESADESAPLPNVQFTRLQKCASELRSQITADVGTREPPLYPRRAG